MALVIVRGPAGSGKSGYVERERRPGEVVADFTAVYAAISGATRGPDGKLPRAAGYGPADTACGMGQSRNRTRGGAAPVIRICHHFGQFAPGEIERLRRLGASDAEPVTLDPGREIAEARLTDTETGQLHPQCGDGVGSLVWAGRSLRRDRLGLTRLDRAEPDTTRRVEVTS